MIGFLVELFAVSAAVGAAQKAHDRRYFEPLEHLNRLKYTWPQAQALSWEKRKAMLDEADYWLAQLDRQVHRDANIAAIAGLEEMKQGLAQMRLELGAKESPAWRSRREIEAIFGSEASRAEKPAPAPAPAPAPRPEVSDLFADNQCRALMVVPQPKPKRRGALRKKLLAAVSALAVPVVAVPAGLLIVPALVLALQAIQKHPVAKSVPEPPIVLATATSTPTPPPTPTPSPTPPPSPSPTVKRAQLAKPKHHR